MVLLGFFFIPKIKNAWKPITKPNDLYFLEMFHHGKYKVFAWLRTTGYLAETKI